jgi:fermentation-respiration switch protein FrsA (DUF1100 family)
VGISRRAFLRLGAAGLAAGAAGVGGLAAAGRLDDAEVFARRHLQGCGPKPAPPLIPVGEIVTGEFASEHMRGPTRYAIAYPPGAGPAAEGSKKPGTKGSGAGPQLPLVLALYGREGDYLRPLSVSALALPRYLAQGVAAGMTPFAIATVEAGPTSYWHKRASGVDPQAMIVEEYLPLLAQRGLGTGRIGLHGDSMGGYGSLLLAQRLGRSRVAAVAVDGPALFRRYADASPVAFDSSEDFAAHDVFAGIPRMAGIPVRVVCGTLDPFYSAAKHFAAALVDPPAQTSWSAACHHVGYWRSETAAQLAFLAGHLSP